MLNVVNRILSNDAKNLEALKSKYATDPSAMIGRPEDNLDKIVVATQTTMTAMVVYDVLRRHFDDDFVSLLTGLVDEAKQIILDRYSDTVEIPDSDDNTQRNLNLNSRQGHGF
jgi:hypothetical protein